MTTWYRTPFHLLHSLNQLPFGSDVYVVSDTQYQELKQKEAKQEIEILESRVKSYRKTAELIEEEIKTIQKEAGLLPPSKDETSDA